VGEEWGFVPDGDVIKAKAESHVAAQAEPADTLPLCDESAPKLIHTHG